MSESFTIKSRIAEYEVHFVDSFEAAVSHANPQTSFFIVDSGLLELYKDRFKNILPEQQILTVEALEQNKTLNFCQTIIKQLIQKNIRKNCTLVAVGGGIIQDITAFISSILFRGICWEFYPTTLLAQADSCIGSKTSINFESYKNILGGFYPPAQIFIDVDFLKTLPDDEIRSGIGEILHFYLVADSKMTESLMDQYDELIASRALLKEFIIESLRIKKDVIERDEFDRGERNIFNYGHTFGHAIESVSKYTVNHGQAVTMGMDIANYLSMKSEFMSNETFKEMNWILRKNMPSFNTEGYDMKAYYKALSKDKKNIEDDLVCILSQGPGLMFKSRIPLDEKLKTFIRDYFRNYMILEGLCKGFS